MAVSSRQQQNQAQNLLGKMSSAIQNVGHRISEERANLEKFRREHPERYARDCHIWGLEMPPTQVKLVETVAALATGYVGLRSAYYGITAATDTVYEKGWLDGTFRRISGAIRSIFGIATIGIATAFIGHALSINPPDRAGQSRM